MEVLVADLGTTEVNSPHLIVSFRKYSNAIVNRANMRPAAHREQWRCHLSTLLLPLKL